MTNVCKNAVFVKKFYFVEVTLCAGRARVCFKAFDKNLNILHFHKTFLYDIKNLFKMSSCIHIHVSQRRFHCRYRKAGYRSEVV